MKARAAILPGALALIGLGTAYVTWRLPDTSSRGEVTVIHAGPHDVRSVRFEQDPDHWVSLEPGQWEGESVVWIHEHRLGIPKPKITNGHPGPTPPSDRILLGNRTAQRMLSQLSPMRASRVLGKVSEAKLEELGLKKTKEKLAVKTVGGNYRFAVSTTPLGQGAPYLREDSNGKVYLLRGMLVSDLLVPNRMIDRRLHTFPPDQFDRVVVKADGTSRTFEAKQHGTDYLPDLVPPGAPRVDGFAKNWHDQLWKVVTLAFLGKGEVPPSGTPAVKVRVDYSLRGNPVGWMEVGKSGAGFFARTEHTAGWVRISASALGLVRDAQKVVSGKDG